MAADGANTVTASRRAGSARSLGVSLTLSGLEPARVDGSAGLGSRRAVDTCVFAEERVTTWTRGPGPARRRRRAARGREGRPSGSSGHQRQRWDRSLAEPPPTIQAPELSSNPHRKAEPASAEQAPWTEPQAHRHSTPSVTDGVGFPCSRPRAAWPPRPVGAVPGSAARQRCLLMPPGGRATGPGGEPAAEGGRLTSSSEHSTPGLPGAWPRAGGPLVPSRVCLSGERALG